MARPRINAVHRLYDLLVKANPDVGRQIPTVTALNNTLGPDHAANRTKATNAFADYFKVYCRASSCIQEVGGELVDDYLRAIEPVWTGLANTSFGGGWFGGAGLNEGQRSYLRITAEALKEKTGEREMEEVEVGQMISSVDALSAEVMEADIRPHLKKAMLRALQKLKESLRDYWILGAEGIEQALATAAGTVWVNSRDGKFSNSEVAIVDKYSQALGLIADTIAVAVAAYEVAALTAPTILSLASR